MKILFVLLMLLSVCNQPYYSQERGLIEEQAFSLGDKYNRWFYASVLDSISNRIIDKKDNIYGFSVIGLSPEASTNYADYQTKTNLRLPFEGESGAIFMHNKGSEMMIIIALGRRFRLRVRVL